MLQCKNKGLQTNFLHKPFVLTSKIHNFNKEPKIVTQMINCLTHNMMFLQYPPPNIGVIREISTVISSEGQVQYISALNTGNLILKLISYEMICQLLHLFYLKNLLKPWCKARNIPRSAYTNKRKNPALEHVKKNCIHLSVVCLAAFPSADTR